MLGIYDVHVQLNATYMPYPLQLVRYIPYLTLQPYIIYILYYTVESKLLYEVLYCIYL